MHQTTRAELQETAAFLIAWEEWSARNEECQLREFEASLDALQTGLLRNVDADAGTSQEAFRTNFLRLVTAMEKARQEGRWHKPHFNLFAALGCERREDIHSNVLAWLLDPQESHGLGDRFLRGIFIRVFGKTPPDCSRVRVIREDQEGGDRPDIVVAGDNWWLVIENKIDSTELPGQTLRYAQRWGAKGCLGESVFLAFLTPGWRPPACSKFTPASYRMITELLHEMQPSSDAGLFLRKFGEHLLWDVEGIAYEWIW